jgi:hypothetical protein
MAAAPKKSVLPAKRPPTPPDARTLDDFLARLPAKHVFAEPEWLAIFEHLQLMSGDQKRQTESEAPPLPYDMIIHSLDTMITHCNMLRTYVRRYTQNGHID